MAGKLRIGLVGANVQRGSWGTRAHVPALQALTEDYEIKAICTAHQETALEAAKAFGADLAFHDISDMCAHPDIDLVVVAVRIPYHHELVMPALRAGKNVLCEWPLGANAAEAEEMASLAAQKGVLNVVGLQGRSDPGFNYLRDLVRDGYVGEVVACHLTVIGSGALERTPDRVWTATRSLGNSVMTVAGGHSIDSLCMIAGEFAEVAGRVTTQVKQFKVVGSGEIMSTDSPDQVLISGVLENGAVAQVHVATMPHHGSGMRMEIYGREGSLFVQGSGIGQMGGSNTIMGARAGEQLAPMAVPERYVLAPEGMAAGSAYNVAGAYTRIHRAVARGERSLEPDFALALRRHRLLEAIVQASDEGRTVKLDRAGVAR